MKEKFTLRYDGDTKGHAMTFNPFGEGERKAKVIAIRFRNFMRNHVSSTQYDEILLQFTKDLKIVKNKIVRKKNY